MAAKRKVGKFLTKDREFNLEQVRAGYAWHYKRYIREQSTIDGENYAQAKMRTGGTASIYDEMKTPNLLVISDIKTAQL